MSDFFDRIRKWFKIDETREFDLQVVTSRISPGEIRRCLNAWARSACKCISYKYDSTLIFTTYNSQRHSYPYEARLLHKIQLDWQLQQLECLQSEKHQCNIGLRQVLFRFPTDHGKNGKTWLRCAQVGSNISKLIPVICPRNPPWALRADFPKCWWLRPLLYS